MKLKHHWLLYLSVVVILSIPLYLNHHPVTSLMFPSQAIPAEKLQRSRVVIVSHGRSGSSFLGGIFNAHPDVFYLYEPLTALQEIMALGSDDFLHQANNVMNSIVNCRFSDGPYLQELSVFKARRVPNKVLASPPFCSVTVDETISYPAFLRHCGNITAHALNDACRNYTHVVTKILLERLKPADISWVLQVVREDLAPVHIVYLVRDPRAMFFSRFKLGWVAPKARMFKSLENGEAEIAVEIICNATIRNLVQVARQQHRIQLVRYEDLATNPDGVAEHLFKVVGISTSENVSRWIQNKNRGGSDADPYSLSRLRGIAINAWRKNIPLKLLNIVEDKCRKVMDYLGYIRINGQMKLLRDGNKTLFSDRISDLNMLLREVDGSDETR